MDSRDRCRARPIPWAILWALAWAVAACGGSSSSGTAFLDRQTDARRPAATRSGARAEKSGARASKKSAGGASLRTLALSRTPVKLLGGRLLVRLPESARVDPFDDSEQPGAGRMRAREAFRIEHGVQRFLVVVVELFARHAGDLEAEVGAEVERWGQRPSAFAIDSLANPSCPVVRVVPAEALFLGLQDGIDDLALVDLLYVGSPDGTVQTIAIHANDAAARERDALTALAGRIGTTVHAGRVAFDTSGGTRKFTVFRRGPELRIDLPDSTVAFEEEGRDSDAYTIRVLRPLGGKGGTLRITVGGAAEALPPGGRRARARSHLMGQPAQWTSYSTADGLELRLVHRTAVQPISIVISADDQDAIDDLRAIAETLVLSRTCDGPVGCPPGEVCRHEHCRLR